VSTTEQPPATDPTGTDEVGHTHADVSGGWLRAAVFGAMDGLVTNVSLVAGIGAAGAAPRTVVLTGVAGLVSGAFSMALGEFASVRTQNEQVDAEAAKERRELAANPVGEEAELVEMFAEMGMSTATATTAAREVHSDPEKAVKLHLTHELGVDPDEQPSPLVAAGSSFVMFALGAVVPLIPYLLGFASLALGLAAGALGLLVAGAVAAQFTSTPRWRAALRQLLFGVIAAGATYLVGRGIGVGPVG
jgi:VIT1/CCC1 family predicted Fe2+/Mn2+ transporter